MGYFDETMRTLATALSVNSYKDSLEKHESLVKQLIEIQEKTGKDFLSLVQMA